MHPNDLPLHHPLFTSITDLERCLDPSAAQTFRQLSDVLLFPADIPRLPTVLTVVCNSISAYGATLQAPNLLFRHIKDVVDGLRDVVLDKLGWTTSSHELAHPLLKRLLPHAPYALCLSAGMVPAEEASRYWIAIGVEIASCLATGKIFARSFANDLRRDITPQLFRGKGPIDAPVRWADTAARKIRLAANLFEADGPSEPSDTQGTRLFDLKSGFELSRKLRYAPPRQRQAILDRHHQTGWQIRDSAAQLFARAEDGDQTALLTIIAFLAGLSLSTAKDMPIDSTLAGDESVMALNLDDGSILTNLSRLTPSAAKPSPNATIFRPASWISVKPLPAIVVEFLRRLAAKCPSVATLGELLPMATTSGHQPTLTDDQSALRPTTARFLASAGPVAVALGIDRLSAALLTNDFSVIPGSKLYYSLAAREPIWDAANRLFGAMGWGAVVPLVQGPPVGSHIVPERKSIKAWLAWMIDEVQRLSPGRNSGLSRLVAHHNAYAHYCASVTVWLLAAREAKEFHFTTTNLNPTAFFASVCDKRVGFFPGELWIPLCSALQQQISLWLIHCLAFERRLRKLGLPPEHSLIVMLKQFNGGKSSPMFFAVCPKTFRPRVLGSADLTRWWPESHRFSPDLGRHFWETELREAMVPSSSIDLLMRHITRAVESHCSTSAALLTHVASDITAVQTDLLKRLGFNPLAGLTSRPKESSCLC